MKSYPFPILRLALLFPLKSCVRTFFVTLLWGVPDEAGHFSHAWDPAKERGVPAQGSNEIGAGLLAHMRHVSER